MGHGTARCRSLDRQAVLIRFCRGEHLIDGTKGVREMIFRNSKSAAYNTMSLRKLYVLTVLTVVAAMTSPPRLCAQQSQKPLTNPDVIRMVKAGVLESAIISSIQSSNCNFDLSPDALVVLHRAGVGQKILEAMMATGGGDQTSPPGAQNAGPPDGPSRPKTTKLTPAQSKAMLAKLKAKPGHLGPIITNPPPPAEAALIATLVRQKQFVHPGQTMSSTGDPAGGQSTPPGTPGTPSGNPTGGPPNAGGLQKSSPTTPSNQVGGSSKSSSAASARAVAPVMAAAPQTSGSSGSNRMLHSNGLVVNGRDVLNGPPIVKGLGGEKYGVDLFSQDPVYNPFYVDGCHFGTAQGQAYLKSSSGQKLADLVINSWTDTLVTVTVNPSLVDALDQDNVTLVIVAPGGQGQKAGFKFHAMGREIPLPAIPAKYISLAQITDSNGVNVRPLVSSPYQGMTYSYAYQAGFVTNPNYLATAQAEGLNYDKGMTVGVDRNDWYRFGGGTDVYDFSQLKPGFYVSKFQIDERNIPVCNKNVDSSLDVLVINETDYQYGSWNALYYLSVIKIRVN